VTFCPRSKRRVAAMTISSGFTVWTAQLASTPPPVALNVAVSRFYFLRFHAACLGAPTSGPVQSASGALVMPCKSALVVLAGATGSNLWSTSITPANQNGGVAIVGAAGGAAGTVRIVLTAFDGSLILFSANEALPQTPPPPATTAATSAPVTSAPPSTAANQTNQSTAIKPPVAAVTAPPGSTPSPPPSDAPSVPFAGASADMAPIKPPFSSQINPPFSSQINPPFSSQIPFAGFEIAIALSACAFAIVLCLASAPLLHKLWLSRHKEQVRQHKLAQSLDKAAKAVQQRQMDEHGNRNARIDEWLANQDLPRALPVLKPLTRSPASIATASTVERTLRDGKDFNGSSSFQMQQPRSTAMAMKVGALKVGALPHSQWRVQRGGSFTTANSSLEALPSATAPVINQPRLPPTLPPLPSHLAPLKQ
jgi:hypothetical protein